MNKKASDIRSVAEYFKNTFTGSPFGIKVHYIVVSNYNHLYVELFTNLGEYRWHLEDGALKGFGGTTDSEIPRPIADILEKLKFKTVIDAFGDIEKLECIYTFKVNKKRVDVFSSLVKSVGKIPAVDLSNELNFALPKWNVRVGKNMLVSMVYESNRIEGSNLSFAETMETIENINEDYAGDIPRLEAKNLYLATKQMLRFARKNININKTILLDLHGMLLHEINNANNGIFRRARVYIRGASSEFSPADLVESHIDQMFKEYEDFIAQGRNPIEIAAFMHSRFVGIHPFADGNGRTARLLMNYVLLQNGYEPVNISADKDRSTYYEVVDYVHKTGKYARIIELVDSKVGSENATVNATVKYMLAYLRENPSLTIDELAINLQKNRSTIIRNLETLKIMGYIKRMGSDKSGYWKVIKGD